MNRAYLGKPNDSIVSWIRRRIRTTGGMWILRLKSEDDELVLFQFIYNSQNGHWDWTYDGQAFPEIYVEYADGVWKFINGEVIVSDVTAADAKEFDVEYGGIRAKFKWNEKVELVDLEVVPVYDAECNAGYVCIDGGLSCQLSSQALICQAGEDEHVMLSAGSTDIDVAEFLSWSNGETSSQIQVDVGSGMSISAMFSVKSETVGGRWVLLSSDMSQLAVFDAYSQSGSVKRWQKSDSAENAVAFGPGLHSPIPSWQIYYDGYSVDDEQKLHDGRAKALNVVQSGSTESCQLIWENA